MPHPPNRPAVPAAPAGPATTATAAMMILLLPPEQEETGPGYVEVKDETGKVTKYEVSNENGLRTWAQAVKENPALDCTLTAAGIPFPI